MLRKESNDAGGTFGVTPAVWNRHRQRGIDNDFLTEPPVDQGYNPVPDADTGHVAPHLDDVARGIQSDDSRSIARGGGLMGSTPLGQVGTIDGRVPNPNLHLVWARFLSGEVPHRQNDSLGSLLDDDCFYHCGHPFSASPPRCTDVPTITLRTSTHKTMSPRPGVRF